MEKGFVPKHCHWLMTPRLFFSFDFVGHLCRYIEGRKVMNELKFSANLTFLFPEIDELTKKYALAKDAGFVGVECGNNVYDYTCHQLEAARQESGVKQCHINAFTGDTKGLACLPNKVEEFKESLQKSMEYCKALKCQRLHIMAGVFPQDRMNISEEIRRSYHETYVRNLQYASNVMQDEDVTILIEPISTIQNYFLETTEQAIKIHKEVNRDNVKIQLDLFHQQRTGGNLTEVIANNLKCIGHIQVSQVPDRNEPDADGEINYKYIFELLKKLKYDGWIGCEYKPSSAREETFNWMRDII